MKIREHRDMTIVGVPLRVDHTVGDGWIHLRDASGVTRHAIDAKLGSDAHDLAGRLVDIIGVEIVKLGRTTVESVAVSEATKFALMQSVLRSRLFDDGP